MWGIYDMSNKKFGDIVWKDKLWGQIGEELEKYHVIFHVFY
jgi:hypothetical protein